jgi:hypothetical protein
MSYYSVRVSLSEIDEWTSHWPVSGMRDAKRPITFTFAPNGDVVDISGEPPNASGEALNAMMDDARKGKIGRRLQGKSDYRGYRRFSRR